MPRNEFKAGDRGDDPEVEDLSQEVHPIEEDPGPDRPDKRSLADLRRSHQSVTEAHIAEREEFKRRWEDPDYLFEL